MGFDLEGLSPKLKKGSVLPVAPDWDKCTDEEKSKYWEEFHKVSEENKGVYFRSNIWWWHVMVDYVYNFTGEIPEKDYDAWHFNDGHKVDEERALRIADTLEILIEKGHAKEHEKMVMAGVEKATKNNLELGKKIIALQKQVEEQTGKKELSPDDYPKEFKAMWNELMNEFDVFGASRFSEEFLKTFVVFCKNSGGFKIL